jgi:hypothetical protein
MIWFPYSIPCYIVSIRLCISFVQRFYGGMPRFIHEEDDQFAAGMCVILVHILFYMLVFT